MASEPQRVVGAVLKWWRTLQNDSGSARAASARLRRASGLLEALMLEDALDLVKTARQAAATRPTGDFEQRLVVLAMILARVKGESGTSFARALGETSGDERPRLSPARFGALLRAARARNWDAFARALRRALAILGDTPIDVARLVGDVLFLNDATLRRWAYDYWQTSAPTDADSLSSASTDLETAS